jgi:ArsR family transcriptional regulator
MGWKLLLVFNGMEAMRSKRSNKRLERLCCSGLRPEQDLEKYAAELKTIADEATDEKTIDMKTRLLKALANETRLKILELLSKREMCVCELTVALDLTQPTASHHLNILENMGLIKDKKIGKWVFYNVTNPELTQHFFEFLGFKK